jgi:hypothetical protein
MLKCSFQYFQRRKRHLIQSPNEEFMASQSFGQPGQGKLRYINIYTANVSS